ncbi:MAG TPA: hypothetical protein VIK77_06160 [Tissierellaceae bacterium]
MEIKMHIEINEEIYLLKEQLRAKEKLESLRNMAVEEFRKNQIILEDLKVKLQKEKKDVAKLESTTLSSFFYSVIGKKDEKLDKEMEEYLAAKIKYDEHVVAMNELKKLIDEYDEELKKFEGIEGKYKMLLDEKQMLLINEDSAGGRNLRQLLDRLNDLKLNMKEVREAINAGENAYNALLEMKKPLESARGWGIWDIFGGGFISDLMKHSNIDEANRLSYDVQHKLRVFQKELSDVNEFTDINVNISGFARFADFFFDGLFADWFVQSKINESLSNVEIAIKQVRRLLEELRSDLKNMENEKLDIESKINAILES